jgi:thiopeptide-type bacteriocin biosynthesis protein
LTFRRRAGGLSAAWFLPLAEAMHALPALWSDGLASYRAQIADYLAQGTLTRRVPLLDVVYAVARSARLEDTLAATGPVPSSAQGALLDTLMQRLWQADLDGSDEIQLSEADLAAVPGRERAGGQGPAPPRFVEAWVRLLRHRGRTRPWLLSASRQIGLGANRLLQRMPDEPMLAQLRSIWSAQEQAAAPAILAEITGGGGGRARELSRRPVTYAHQIVLHGAASVPPSQQIHPHELSVFLSAEGPVLWWEARGVPVLAHQLSTVLLPAYSPVVHVLLALDPRPRSWGLRLPTLGLPVRTARVCYRDLILRPQTWLLPPNLRHALRQSPPARDEAALRRLLADWRARYQVPRIVRLGDMEHSAVDLEGPLALVELADLVDEGLERVTEEFLDEDSPVYGKDGPAVAEAVVQLSLARVPAPRGTALAIASDARVAASGAGVQPAPGSLETPTLREQHTFSPGSRWLYLKLYYGGGLGSEAAARTFVDDDLLARSVAPLLAELERKRLIADFHFVRYADPEAHLRLRLRPASDDPDAALRLLRELAPRLDAEARARAVERWTVDTYVRELDRYGGPQLIEHAERLFTADSRLCLRILGAQRRDRLHPEREVQRLLPVVTLHRLLQGFGLDLSAREALLARLRARQAATEPWPTALRRRLDAEYRRLAPTLAALLRHVEGEAGAPLLARADVQGFYAPYLAAVAEAAAAYHRAGSALTAPLTDILCALFHMHCNRLHESPALEAEAVYFAQRAADAVLAQRRRASAEGRVPDAT